MISLYKITDEYKQTNDRLLEQEDLTPEIINDTLSVLSDELEKKALNVGAYFKNLLKEISIMKEYESEMRARRQKFQNYADKLKHYLKVNLEKCNIDKIKGEEFTISIRKTPDRVIIDNVYDLDVEFISRTEIHADKNHIKKKIQETGFVSGAHLESGTTLVIK